MLVKLTTCNCELNWFLVILAEAPSRGASIDKPGALPPATAAAAVTEAPRQSKF
jgi:hypothetical protein